MASQTPIEEKSSYNNAVHEEHENDAEFDKQPPVETRIVMGDEAFQAAKLKEPPPKWSSIAFRLYLISIVGFFASTSNGYDSSMFGTLLTNDSFKAFFGVQDSGIWTGIVTSMQQIGSVVAIPFIGPAVDTFGRRAGMFFWSHRHHYWCHH